MANVARLALLILLGGLCACSARNSARPLKDGTWEVKCEDRVDRCVREAQRVCGDEPYHVVSGKKDEEVYGGQTGYQVGVDVHTLEFRCGADPAVWKLERKEEPAPAEPKGAPAPSKKKACTPGSTQRCVGPGACEGGQSCNADGTGYSPCDCGTPSPDVPPASPAPPASAAPPASSAAPVPASADAPATSSEPAPDR